MKKERASYQNAIHRDLLKSLNEILNFYKKQNDDPELIIEILETSLLATQKTIKLSTKFNNYAEDPKAILHEKFIKSKKKWQENNSTAEDAEKNQISKHVSSDSAGLVRIFGLDAEDYYNEGKKHARACLKTTRAMFR